MRELYRVWPSELGSKDIDRLLQAAQNRPVETGKVFSPTDALSEMRSCQVQWLPESWIQDLLWPYVENAATHAFDVSVHNRAEVQLATYSAQHGDHYDWHQDVYWNDQSDSDRKLSITVQLSHSRDYTGGAFEFEDIQTNADFRSRGTILIFPSYLRHKVHRVTSGSRRALVAWFFGPRWR